MDIHVDGYAGVLEGVARRGFDKMTRYLEEHRECSRYLEYRLLTVGAWCITDGQRCQGRG